MDLLQACNITHCNSIRHLLMEYPILHEEQNASPSNQEFRTLRVKFPSPETPPTTGCIAILWRLLAAILHDYLL